MTVYELNRALFGNDVNTEVVGIHYVDPLVEPDVYEITSVDTVTIDSPYGKTYRLILKTLPYYRLPIKVREVPE